MIKCVLPGKRNNFFSESELFREEFLAFIVKEVVEILPVEDKFDESSVLEGAEESADVNVSNIGSLVGLSSEVLVEDNDSFLEKVSVDGLLFGFLDLDHVAGN